MKESLGTKQLAVVATHLRIALRFAEQQAAGSLTDTVQTVMMHVEGAYEMLRDLAAMLPVSSEGISPVGMKQESSPASAIVVPVVEPEVEVVPVVPKEKIKPEQTTPSTFKSSPVVPSTSSTSEAESAVPLTAKAAPKTESAHEEARVADTFAHRPVLHESLSRREDTVQTAKFSSITSVAKAMTINDRMRFTAELFAGDREHFLATLQAVEQCSSLPEALETLQANYSGPADNPLLTQFISLLERRFQG